MMHRSGLQEETPPCAKQMEEVLESQPHLTKTETETEKHAILVASFTQIEPHDKEQLDDQPSICESN